jgi:lipoprotein-releasing system permease protein
LYPIFLALRYARSRVVTYLALLTVAVSVASFVVVMSVLGGFRHEVEEIIQETGAPLEIYCSGSWGIYRADGVAARVAQVDGVRGTSPYIQAQTLIRTERYRAIGLVQGIDLAKELRYGQLGQYLKAELPVENVEGVGEVRPPPAGGTRPEILSFKVPKHLQKRRIKTETLQPWEDPNRKQEKGTVPVWFVRKRPKEVRPHREEDDDEGLIPRKPETPGTKPQKPRAPRGVIVGAKRARDLGLYPGDEVIMAVQDRDEENRARVRSFTVVGFYESKTDWLNALIFIDRRAAEDLTGQEEASGISIWLGDNRQMFTVRDAVRGVFREDRYTKVRTWKESRPEVFGMMDMQDRVMMIILLIFFVMTGAFIMAILWVLVSEKIRDIGTVRALGAGRFGVVITFVTQGLAIASVGVGLGLGLGWLLSENVNPAVRQLDAFLNWLGAGEVFGSISRGLFDMKELPVHRDPVHVVSMTVTTLGVSFLASLFPALRAAFLDPVEALRHE